MLRLPAAALLGLCLAACSPTFNWRELRPEGTPLKVMLPCKPDKGSRPVPMAGRQVEMHVLGCDTGGATFAVMFADVGDAGRAGEVLAQWRQATLANMRASAPQARPFLPPGAVALPQSQRVTAHGQRSDGSPVRGDAAYFARGSQVFQAVIYSGELKADTADTFFEGLKLE